MREGTKTNPVREERHVELRIEIDVGLAALGNPRQNNGLILYIFWVLAEIHEGLAADVCQFVQWHGVHVFARERSKKKMHCERIVNVLVWTIVEAWCDCPEVDGLAEIEFCVLILARRQDQLMGLYSCELVKNRQSMQ